MTDDGIQISEELPRDITATKEENFGRWFDETLSAAGLVDKRYEVKGMFVWLNYGFEVMKRIKFIWDGLFTESGIKEMYFPLIVPLEYAKQNDSWLEGFKSQAYWVKGLEEPEARHILRPTGEPAMYPMFSLWIRSYSDLPLRIYETVSSFRYETKMTRPLIRDREITMWYEIHTAHATKEEADREIEEAVRINDVIWKKLAIPTIKVEKPQWECFPGAVGAIEYYSIMPDGKAVENGSCNHLGQAYAKKFNIKFKDKQGEEKFAWQTCTGNGARYFVAVLAIHGDNKGAVLPPEIAPIQVVITTISQKGKEKEVQEKAQELSKKLSEEGVRVYLDASNKTPGEKFFEWEIKGVPIRIEVGPKDLKTHNYVVFRRDENRKTKIEEKSLVAECRKLLGEIQENLLKKAQKFYDEKIAGTDRLEEIKTVIDAKKIAKVSWCESAQCWDKIKEISEGIELFGTIPKKDKGRCVICGKESCKKGYVAKTY